MSCSRLPPLYEFDFPVRMTCRTNLLLLTATLDASLIDGQPDPLISHGFAAGSYLCPPQVMPASDARLRLESICMLHREVVDRSREVQLITKWRTSVGLERRQMEENLTPTARPFYGYRGSSINSK